MQRRRIESLLLALMGCWLCASASESYAQCYGGRCGAPSSIMVPQTTWQPVQSYAPVTTYQPAQLTGYTVQSYDRWYPGKRFAQWWGSFGRGTVMQPIYTMQQQQPARQQQPAQPNYQQSYQGPTPPRWNQPAQRQIQQQ